MVAANVAGGKTKPDDFINKHKWMTDERVEADRINPVVMTAEAAEMLKNMAKDFNDG